GGIDCVLLIVASDESVMPQTREHFEICRLLRIPRGIVVLTKADLSDAETRALVKQDVADLVKGSFLESAPVIDVSATSGEGLDELRAAIIAQASRAERRPIDGPTRLPIDRAFTMKGFGTVITGTLVSGTIAVDAELVVEPGGRRVKVRGVQVHGQSATEAVAGQRTAINLGGVEVGEVTRGETLTAPGMLSVTRRVDAAIDLLASAKPLKHGARVRIHHGTAEILGRVSIAGTSTEVAPGGGMLVRLRLEAPAVLTRGDRFIIRAYSPPITIGGGIVLDPVPQRPGIRTAEGRAFLDRIAVDSDGVAPLLAMIDAAGLPGIARGTLVSRAGIAPAKVSAMVQSLAGKGIVTAGDRLVASRHLQQAAERMLALVTASHKANSMSEGLAREEAREKIFAKTAPAVFEKVLDDLKMKKALVGAERLALPTHKVTVAGADDRVRTAVIDAYRAGGLKPPGLASLEAAAKSPSAVIEKVIALLLREKVLTRLETIVFHSDALQQLKTEVSALKQTAPGGRATVDVAAFKDRYGVSRKFAIPLLEYLDRERVTRRTGDVRLVL
ncbi:MAG: SelB C-terminal domain-containing protein, partial [Acidobacteriota bacterium]